MSKLKGLYKSFIEIIMREFWLSLTILIVIGVILITSFIKKEETTPGIERRVDLLELRSLLIIESNMELMESRALLSRLILSYHEDLQDLKETLMLLMEEDKK